MNDMTIKELIREAKLALKKSSANGANVGNRPYYPMLMLYNGAFSDSAVEQITARLGRIWPKAREYLASYVYEAETPEETTFFALPGRGTVSAGEVTAALDGTRAARDVFGSMRQWRLYNILDTRACADVEDFIAQYRALPRFREVVVDAAASMLVVLLDDSALKRSLAGEIREFLAEHREYDCTVIISNRNRKNAMCAMEELYGVVASVLLTSNNETASAPDSGGYKKRAAALYDGGIYTVSHILQDRPNEKIAIQILAVLLDRAAEEAGAAPGGELNDWNRALGLENFKSPVCERFLDSLRLEIDRELFDYLPLRKAAMSERVSLSQMPCARARRYTFDDVLERLAEDYCSETLAGKLDLARCVAEFREDVMGRVPVSALRQLSDSAIDKLSAQLDPGSADENEPLPDYFEQQVRAYIRGELLYPQFARTLRELRVSAAGVAEELVRLSQEFRDYIPLELERDIGAMYKNAAVSYLESENGRRQLARVCMAGNDREELLRQVLACFQDVLRQNEALFAMPFIDAWAQMLGLQGDRVYRAVSESLTSGADDVICLSGNYPLDKRMKVYMLHSADAAGQPTRIYEFMQAAFAGDQAAQYFNTGYDDDLEALVFVACEGMNLRL